MVDESVNIEDSFPVPNRGVPILCPLNMRDGFGVPLIYFGRETRATNREVPESPEPCMQLTQSSQRSSSNPLNSIIRKWETAFALQGSGMDSEEFVSSNGRGDDRYYHADEWLDNGAEDNEGENEEYFGEVDVSAFRAIPAGELLEVEEEISESDVTDEEDEVVEDAGGNWQILVRRLDAGRQSVVKDLVLELEAFQAFPGHTKQKKSKSLRDGVSRLRRLVPKVNQLQTQWQAAVWAIVSSVNDSVTMQQFIEMWNEVSPQKQKEEVLRERDELISKIGSSGPLQDLAAAWQRGEAIQRFKNEPFFNMLARVWELWVQEGECAGRITPDVIPGKPYSKAEKRLAELIPEVSSEVAQILVRISLVGSRKAKKSPDEEATSISLPATVYVYRRNELLKCKLVDIKGLSSHTILVSDKEWEAETPSSSGEVEFSSLESLFESYQQKFIRKQDRVVLPSPFEAWKYFAIKQGQEYSILYDVAQKAAAVCHYGFTDKAGNPIFLPSVAAARSADIEKRKKLNDIKEQRKRKRDAVEAKAKEVSSRNPPFNETFLPFPQFSKDLFLPSSQTDPRAPEIQPESISVDPPPDEIEAKVVDLSMKE